MLAGTSPCPGSVDVELTIRDHCARESRVVLKTLPALLGRDDRADVRLDDPWVSRMHGMFNEINGTLVVRDLGAKNGVFVNGHRVSESNVLPGECLTFGLTKITVHYRRIAQPSDSAVVPPVQSELPTPPDACPPSDSELHTMELFR